MCTNLSVISFHLNTVKNLLTLFWNSLDLLWEAGIAEDSCRHGKTSVSTDKHVKKYLFSFCFLPFKFLDCLRQHNNCSLIGCTVALFLGFFWGFELFSYAKGEGGMWKDKIDPTLLPCNSSRSPCFPGEKTCATPRETRPGCLHRPPAGKTSLATCGSFGCWFRVHRGGFVPGWAPGTVGENQDNFL